MTDELLSLLFPKPIFLRYGDSPIEQRFLGALASFHFDHIWEPHDRAFDVRSHDSVFIDGCRPRFGKSLTVIPQARLRIDTWAGVREIRVDFMLFQNLRDGCFRVLAIECDGFIWHDRDKSQFIAERARNRALTLAHIPVISFTGTEIVKDAERCASEVLRCWDAGSLWRFYDLQRYFPAVRVTAPTWWKSAPARMLAEPERYGDECLPEPERYTGGDQ